MSDIAPTLATSNSRSAPPIASRRRLRRQEDFRAELPELFAQLPPIIGPARVTVIGSGFAGAVAALRLGALGIRTRVLERGLRWPHSRDRQIFATDTRPDGRGYRFRKEIVLPSSLRAPLVPFAGVLDITGYDTIDVWRAACVGGGSVVFAGVMVRPERQYFDALFGGLVDFAQMDSRYYPLVERMFDVASLPEDVAAASVFDHAAIWNRHVTAAGFSPERVNLAFQWPIIRDELHGRCRPSATVGESNLGNSNGAKFDVTQNYLRQAEATGNVEICASTEVVDVRSDAHDGYELEIVRRDPFGTQIDRTALKTDYVFFAAGSIGTSELLVRARARGLPDLNEHVGEGWGTNGDCAVIRSGCRDVGRVQAVPCASLIRVLQGETPAVLENWYDLGAGGDLGISASLGLAFDVDNRGRFRYEAATDTVKLHWPQDGNAAAIAALRRISERICEAAGVTAGIPSLGMADVDGRFTAHPLGGAVLGRACDAYGRLHGYRGLYVIDGATIPGNAGGVNPSLTICALAERNVEEIIRTDFRQAF